MKVRLASFESRGIKSIHGCFNGFLEHGKVNIWQDFFIWQTFDEVIFLRSSENSELRSPKKSTRLWYFH